MVGLSPSLWPSPSTYNLYYQYEFGSQKFLTDRNLALKYYYWTEIWYRDLLGFKMTFHGVWHWRTDSCKVFQESNQLQNYHIPACKSWRLVKITRNDILYTTTWIIELIIYVSMYYFERVYVSDSYDSFSDKVGHQWTLSEKNEKLSSF